MYNSSSDPMLTNCTFIENSALYYGGGISNYASSPILVNCTFNGNSVNAAGNALGGAIYFVE
jgi:hypothetical protein